MKSLDPALAAKFIEKFSNVFENNINIMNQKGIIIGSKDASRIGTFHEVAHSLLQQTASSGDVTENDHYIGTKTGVNYCINYRTKPIGVVGISGNVSEVRPLGLIIKTAIESMLEYEFQMETERLQHSKMEQLVYSLLYNDRLSIEFANQNASALSYKIDGIRVPILIDCHEKTEPHKLLSMLKQSAEASLQDITAVLKNGQIIIFKFIGTSHESAISSFKEDLEFYILSIKNMLKQKPYAEQLSFFIGSLQCSLKYYKEAYQQLDWLSLSTKGRPGNHFFYDHVSDYFKSLASIKSYDEIFSVYQSALNEEKQSMFIEIYDALLRNNYNVVNSAKELYIHRNTLLFRINKLNALLNIDPISNYQHRELVAQLVYYYKNR